MRQIPLPFPPTYIIDDVKTVSADLEEIPLSSDMVTGSDSWKNDSATSCLKTVDGDYSTYFDGLGNGYVQIDLGGYYDISAVGIVPRSGYAYRCVDAVISCSEDGENWTEACVVKNPPFDGLNYFTHLAANKNIRYIRYQVPDGAPANPYNQDDVYCCNLAEISVYGAESAAVRGDVDADGALTVADAVMLQKWLHGSGELTAPENADLCEDGAIDIFDLGLLRQALLEKSA